MDKSETTCLQTRGFRVPDGTPSPQRLDVSLSRLSARFTRQRRRVPFTGASRHLQGGASFLEMEPPVTDEDITELRERVHELDDEGLVIQLVALLDRPEKGGLPLVAATSEREATAARYLFAELVERWLPASISFGVVERMDEPKLTLVH
jgi:hypothetical protein